MDIIHDQNTERNLSFIKRDSDDFGLLFLGDSATIYRITLLKILVSGGKLPVSLLEPVDCQVHLAYGGEKGGNFTCTRFLEHIQKLILISQSQMFSCLMELQTYSLMVNCRKLNIQRFQLYVRLKNCIFLFK